MSTHIITLRAGDRVLLLNQDAAPEERAIFVEATNGFGSFTTRPMTDESVLEEVLGATSET